MLSMGRVTYRPQGGDRRYWLRGDLPLSQDVEAHSPGVIPQL